MVKFVTNMITCGNPKTSFSDLVKQASAKETNKLVKTAASEKKEKDEAESSGQPEAEAKLTNNPKVEDEKKKKASVTTATCKKCEKKDCKCDGECECKGGKKACAHTKTDTTKVASGSNEDDKAKSSGQLAVEPLHQKGESVKPSAVTEQNKKTEVGKGGAKEENKEASTAPRFVRVAKLNKETKAMLRKYWELLYPADYVEAMLQDK